MAKSATLPLLKISQSLVVESLKEAFFTIVDDEDALIFATLNTA